ncbi:IS5 family transposase [Nostoc sp. ChiQUE01b]|uniref:IS5 family transposase n=1 Tax=Nostoc sp. ChiQUE01b TaxID=3075376 RepID=UPI002AD50B0C|nr:IS5 family transposase [Nostoc sp. ChiQUE01b]MDZ8259883.1 IS5 family transposase [Nostoc sp. ChiQUE01b]
MTYEQVKSLKSEDFKRLCGVRPDTFNQILEVLRSHSQPKQKTGRPGKLSLEDQLLMTLEYWREYRTYFHIGQSWGINESTAYRIIRKIEDTLMKSRIFTLPGKKKLTTSNYQLEVVVVDVTESPIERPKKKQKKFYSGKKKQHTLKSQVVVDQANGQIICTAHGKGREHDFRIFKNSKVRLRENIEYLGDKGYQGIQKLHANSRISKKKPRGGTLTCEDKKSNQELASIRVLGEHVNRKLKIFKILSLTYRNRRKRFSLRFNLIAALYNYELHLPQNEFV